MRVSRIIACFSCLLLVNGAPPLFAETQLERFFPAVVAIAQQSTIKAEGKFASWPPTIVCDRPDVNVTAGEASGELMVGVDANSAPGVAWIRLHDDVSASRLVPLMIEPVAVSIEVEPNNKIAEAMKITSPGVVSGRLEKSGDLDTYRISAQAGQTLVVSLIANRVLRSPMDAVLQLVDGSGNVLLQTDDDRGLDPQLVYQVTSEDELLIRVFAFPEVPTGTIAYAGDAAFVYVLRATTDGMLDHVIPIVSGDELATLRPWGWNFVKSTDVQRSTATEISPPTLHLPGSIGWQWQNVLASAAESVFESDDQSSSRRAERLPVVFSGHLLEPGEVDRFQFDVAADEKIRVAVEAKRYGFPLDSVLRLVNPQDGIELAKNDDRGRNEYDAALDYQAKEGGVVELQISDLVDGFGPGHSYSVIVEPSRPAYRVELSAEQFLIKAGGEIEIPVNLVRLHRFDQALEISAERLPTGVTAEPVISEPQGDSAKLVKLKLVAAEGAAYQGPFRIVAHQVDAEGKRSGVSSVATFPLREAVMLRDVWLTVAKPSD